jgi:hypothetical protein
MISKVVHAITKMFCLQTWRYAPIVSLREANPHTLYVDSLFKPCSIYIPYLYGAYDWIFYSSLDRDLYEGYYSATNVQGCPYTIPQFN